MSNCVECDEDGTNTRLHQHHISYERDETVTLCASCHRKVHSDESHELYPEEEYESDKAMIKIDDETRDELRRFKAEDGKTYDEAIRELLDTRGIEV